MSRNYRVRADDSDDDGVDIKTHQSTSSKSHFESKNILSFGDEIEDDTFTKKTTIKKDIKHKEKRKHKRYVSPKSCEPLELHNQSSVNDRSSQKCDNAKICINERTENITSRIKDGDIPTSNDIDILKKQKRELVAKSQAAIKDIPPTEEIRTISLNLTFADDDDDDTIAIRRSVSKKKTGNRMEMIGYMNNFEKDRQIMRDNFITIEHGLHGESDHENEWENRQMKNAINKSFATQKDTESINWQQDLEILHDSMILNELNTIKIEDLNIPKFKELLRKRKEEILKQQKKTKEELEDKKQMAKEIENKAKTAELEIPILELKYNTFNNFKHYISMLADCFDEKMEKIVYLEKKYLKFFKERADKLSKRKRQDVKDQFDEIIINTKSSSVIQSTYDASQRASRISDRESRRFRRLKAREACGTMISHYEGLSSDDEEPKSTISSRQNEIAQIDEESNRLFENIDSEYCQLSEILDRFVKVQEQFEIDYSDAFINGFIAHIISPLVRLELITWNPLMTPRFDKWLWFKTLIAFTKKMVGVEPIKDQSSLEFGYLKLIPNIMEKVILPKITDWIDVWNPMSSNETKNLTSIIGKLISQIPTINDKSAHVKSLLRSIACRINDCIAEDISIPLYIEEYKTNPSGSGFQFFLHQMWSIIKTYSNLMMLHDILEMKLLCKLALDGILNNYILTGLMILMQLEFSSIIIVMIRHIKHSFPQKWFMDDNHELKGDIEKVVKFVLKFGDNQKKDKNVAECVNSFLEYVNVSKSDISNFKT